MIYEPHILLSMSTADLRKQYTKSRDVMQKRYKRLEKEKLRTDFQNFVQNLGGELPKLSDVKRLAEGDPEYEREIMSYFISEMERYKTEQTTVKYQKRRRAEAAEALSDSGYTVDENNVLDFIEFMEYVHASDLDRVLYQDTYEEGTGFRSKRRERTDAEKDRVMDLFNIWKANNKSIPESYTINI